MPDIETFTVVIPILALNYLLVWNYLWQAFSLLPFLQQILKSMWHINCWYHYNPNTKLPSYHDNIQQLTIWFLILVHNNGWHFCWVLCWTPSTVWDIHEKLLFWEMSPFVSSGDTLLIECIPVACTVIFISYHCPCCGPKEARGILESLSPTTALAWLYNEGYNTCIMVPYVIAKLCEVQTKMLLLLVTYLQGTLWTDTEFSVLTYWQVTLSFTVITK